MTKDSHSYIRVTDPRTLNLYAYCGNDPVNKTDPNGTWMEEDLSLQLSVEDCDDIDYYSKMWDSDPANRDYWHSQAEAVREKARNEGKVRQEKLQANTSKEIAAIVRLKTSFKDTLTYGLKQTGKAVVTAGIMAAGSYFTAVGYLKALKWEWAGYILERYPQIS